MTSRIDVSCLERSGISAHSRKEQPGYGTVMINEDSDRDRALQILRAQGFEVSGGVGHYPRRVMSWFAGNVRPTSLLTSEAVPLLDAQGARFQTTRLAMMCGSDRACADYQTPTASSCAVQRREIDPFGRGLGRFASTAACRLRSFRRSSAPGTPTASIL
jgi:hypothetical protein